VAPTFFDVSIQAGYQKRLSGFLLINCEMIAKFQPVTFRRDQVLGRVIMKRDHKKIKRNFASLR
jgi:hypothetical protein